MFYLAAVLFFNLVLTDNDAFISIALDQSSTQAASRVFTTHLSIGRPEKRYLVVVDFERSGIEMNLCMRDVSYTFNVAALDNETTSDLVLFSDDTLLDPVKRGIYRMAVREHCASDEPFSYVPCLGIAGCSGVLGVGTLSPIWIKWSALTLTHTALHFGPAHPLRQQEKSEKIRCSGALDERLCQFNATLAGRLVSVDFHADDSYIYVPSDIYHYYSDERNLYGFTNSQQRSALRVFKGRQRLLDELAHEARRRNATRTLFADHLRNDRQLALQHNAYYRGTHDVTDLAAWPPLVLLPTSGGVENLIVLDYDLLVFSPLYSGTYGKRARSSAMLPFADYMDSTRTLLLRPHANASIVDRVSIGNVFFRHYTVHKDAVRNTLEIAERFSCDNLSDVEVLGGLYLYAYFVFSVCRVMWYVVTLTVSLNRRCPMCNVAMSPYRAHRAPPSLVALLGMLADAALVGIATWALIHIESFLRDAGVVAHGSDLSMRFVSWSWALAIPNLLVVSALLIGGYGYAAAPADGTFCWRTFRWTLARAACSEQLALLGLLWMSQVLAADSLGTFLSVVIAAILFFSATHHFVHLVLYENDFGTTLEWFIRRVAPASRLQKSELPAGVGPPAHTGNFPDTNVNVVWFAFVVVVLFLLNVVFASYVVLNYVVLPTLASGPITFLLYAFAFLAGMWLLDTYERETIRRAQFTPVVY